MIEHAATPRELVASFWRNRHLVLTLARREVLGRYKGSLMGMIWPFLIPLLMLAVYTFVFSVVFKSRWQLQGDSMVEVALVLFAGLMVFNLFSECISRAPRLILSNVNYVKKVVFPLEILPLVNLAAALFQWLVSVTVWLVAYTVFSGIPHPTVLLAPLMILPLLVLVAGLSWMLAALGVYLRDISQIIGVLITMMLFLSPIFYPVSAIPEKYQPLLYLNPLTFIIEQLRGALYWGIAPNLAAFALYTVLAFLFSFLCFVLFQKTRKGFADVL